MLDLSAPWAILPSVLTELPRALAIEARLGKDLSQRAPMAVLDGVAIIDVFGILLQGTDASPEAIAGEFSVALADDRVRSILLSIDSPGGGINGIQELAALMFSARGTKPVAAWTDGRMTSAAYWLGSAADGIYISGDTTMTGSIGVVTKHVDISRAEERLGVKTTEIFAGKYKVMGSAHRPLGDEDLARLQAMVDAIYKVFVDAVGAHRGVDAQVVLDNMAEGRIFLGRKAIDAGLVDGVRTFDQVFAELRARRSTP